MSDDAAVYRLNDDTAAVLTLDFSRRRRRPYAWRHRRGDALSDVFAMGAKPLTALNILAFLCSLGADVVARCCGAPTRCARQARSWWAATHRGRRAGTACRCSAPPRPHRAQRRAQPATLFYEGPRLGDHELGVGGFEDDEGMRPVIASMMELNKAGSEARAAAHVHAATDVTGFGLAGHLHEMLDASDASAELVWDDLPLFEGVYRYSCDFCRPAKTFGIIDWARA
ncbi:MAG: AIR synthase-related protein, partial [Eggerthella lenta]